MLRTVMQRTLRGYTIDVFLTNDTRLNKRVDLGNTPSSGKIEAAKGKQRTLVNSCAHSHITRAGAAKTNAANQMHSSMHNNRVNV